VRFAARLSALDQPGHTPADVLRRDQARLRPLFQLFALRERRSNELTSRRSPLPSVKPTERGI
jgi:hypothetical protein